MCSHYIQITIKCDNKITAAIMRITKLTDCLQFQLLKIQCYIKISYLTNFIQITLTAEVCWKNIHTKHL